MNVSRIQDIHRRRQARLLFAALCCLASGPAVFAQSTAPAANEPVVKLDDLETEAGEDINLIMPTQPIEGVLGLAKPIVDTPRSVTVLSSDLIDSLSIRNSEDIARLVPSTYSNFRFGLQGNVNVRNVTSDFYFRGMRRIDPQGNWRTVFAANDSIEIVRGLPSPIFGLGRIGGYMNFNPKTARLGKTGISPPAAPASPSALSINASSPPRSAAPFRSPARRAAITSSATSRTRGATIITPRNSVRPATNKKSCRPRSRST
jgi:iron complex outermembrane receptor protein